MLGSAGPIAEWKGGRVLVAMSTKVAVYDLSTQKIVAELTLAVPAIAAASDLKRGRGYALLEGNLVQVMAGGETPDVAARVPFGPADRGFFVLPSGTLIGITHDGRVTALRPGESETVSVDGPAPLHAGPAVDPREDAWYFAHRSVTRYELTL
jgi:hypothetical protein